MGDGKYLVRGTRLALSMVAVCAALAATASPALATSSYAAVVTPASAPAGITTTFNVALTNETARDGIDMAMITPPASFTLVHATASQGTIELLPTRVIIRGLSLPLGATVNVSVTATAPAQGRNPSTWTTQAFSVGPNSAGVFLDEGTSMVTTSLTSPRTITSPCPATGCSVVLSTPSTIFRLDVGSGNTGGTVTASVDTGTPMDGPGGLNDPGCASYTPQSPDWYGFNVSDTSQSKTVTWTVNDSNPSTFKTCFGAPYEFGDAPKGTLPDGTPGFVELLPSCPAGVVAFFCTNTTSLEGSPTTTVVTYKIPAGLTGDPYMGR